MVNEYHKLHLISWDMLCKPKSCFLMYLYRAIALFIPQKLHAAVRTLFMIPYNNKM